MEKKKEFLGFNNISKDIKTFYFKEITNMEKSFKYLTTQSLSSFVELINNRDNTEYMSKFKTKFDKKYFRAVRIFEPDFNHETFKMTFDEGLENTDFNSNQTLWECQYLSKLKKNSYVVKYFWDEKNDNKVKISIFQVLFISERKKIGTLLPILTVFMEKENGVWGDKTHISNMCEIEFNNNIYEYDGKTVSFDSNESYYIYVDPLILSKQIANIIFKITKGL